MGGEGEAAAAVVVTEPAATGGPEHGGEAEPAAEAQPAAAAGPDGDNAGEGADGGAKRPGKRQRQGAQSAPATVLVPVPVQVDISLGLVVPVPPGPHAAVQYSQAGAHELTAVMKVPASYVGHIIGKGGQCIKYAPSGPAAPPTSGPAASTSGPLGGARLVLAGLFSHLRPGVQKHTRAERLLNHRRPERGRRRAHTRRYASRTGHGGTSPSQPRAASLCPRPPRRRVPLGA